MVDLQRFGDRAALVDAGGAVTYRELDGLVSRAAAALLGRASDLSESRVAFLIPPGREYVAALLGAWRAGGVAVPLPLSHPPAELDYVIRDAGPTAVVAGPSLADRVAASAAAVGARLLSPSDLATAEPAPAPVIGPSRRAMIVYTSGTTGRPKGAVTTHANIDAQVQSLVEAWGWTNADRALLALPLHHVHGIVNVLCSALWAGATCEMLPKFDERAVWARLASGDITLFTAVPTIYYRLVQQFDAEPELQAVRSAGVRTLRLMMSGSAALPRATLDRWQAISGHILLERYGMTEIGMALANPLVGERRPGLVGRPLPGVEVRLVSESGDSVPDGAAGEIDVRGPGVFLEYWNRPEATAAAFRGGWFRTGDTAIVDGGAYRLLGRTSVDILKSGGFKVSALEVEDTIRQYPGVADCAVVGVDDEEWGQRVCAAIELRGDQPFADDDFNRWLDDRLAPYKRPRDVRVVDALPRNAMGKVIKPDVAAWFVA